MNTKTMLGVALGALAVSGAARADNLELITAAAFRVQILQEGQDVTARFGVQEVRYHRDGTGTRILTDGTVLSGTWRFLDDAQTLVETVVNGRVNRWQILELSPSIYRKRDLDSGVEIIHVPKG